MATTDLDPVDIASAGLAKRQSTLGGPWNVWACMPDGHQFSTNAWAEGLIAFCTFVDGIPDVSGLTITYTFVYPTSPGKTSEMVVPYSPSSVSEQ